MSAQSGRPTTPSAQDVADVVPEPVDAEYVWLRLDRYDTGGIFVIYAGSWASGGPEAYLRSSKPSQGVVASRIVRFRVDGLL